MSARAMFLSQLLLGSLVLGVAPAAFGGWDVLPRLQWERDGKDWPLRETSTFVNAAGLRWHVQQMGQGPVLLLIHGTGASSHSWRDLTPLLAKDHTVIAPDLPGHGFTDPLPPERLSLPGMANALAELLRVLDARPVIVAGHSAGAAILAQMCLSGSITPHTLISLNGALLPFHGAPGRIFAPLAKLLATSSIMPRLFSWRAGDRTAVEQLIDGTGSRLDKSGVELYARLVRSPGHVAGALTMMASWDLRQLEHELPTLRPKLVLVVGSNDKTIKPEQGHQVAAMVPGSELITLPGLGHLAHEERPQSVAEIINGISTSRPVLASP